MEVRYYVEEYLWGSRDKLDIYEIDIQIAEVRNYYKERDGGDNSWNYHDLSDTFTYIKKVKFCSHG